jgi:hypothetical protein
MSQSFILRPYAGRCWSLPAPAAGGFIYHEQTLSNINANLSDYTFVIRFRTDDVTSPEVPGFDITGVKISVQGAVDKLYVGVAAGDGDNYDAESLTQVLFGGNAGVSQTRDQITESDLTAFTWDKATPLLVSLYGGATNASGTKNLSFVNYVDTYGRTGSDEAATLDKTTGYTELGNNVWWIPKVTFFG